MRFLCHENQSTGSIEDARGHTASMERQGTDALSSWKGKDTKTQNVISP